MYAHRPVVDKETYSHARKTSTELGVPTRLLIDASIEAVSADPYVSANAMRELNAWRDGSALRTDQLADLVRKHTDRPVLVLAATNYHDQKSGEDDPITRDGYGLPADEITPAQAAPLVRGYLPVKDSSEEALMVSFRRGIPRLVALASDWKLHGNPWKRYASTFLIADGDRWVNVDNRRSRRKMTPDDLALVKALNGVVLVPTGHRNPVSWVSAD